MKEGQAQFVYFFMPAKKTFFGTRTKVFRVSGLRKQEDLGTACWWAFEAANAA